MVQPVDFIYEQDILGLETGQYRGKVSWFLDDRTGGAPDVNLEFIGDYMGKGCLSQPGTAVEEDVIKRLSAAPRSINEYTQVPLHLFLTYVFLQVPGPEADFRRDFILQWFRVDNSVFHGTCSGCSVHKCKPAWLDQINRELPPDMKIQSAYSGTAGDLFTVKFMPVS